MASGLVGAQTRWRDHVKRALVRSGSNRDATVFNIAIRGHAATNNGLNYDAFRHRALLEAVRRDAKLETMRIG